VVQINAADFHNKHVGKMLRDVAAQHITNWTGKIDWTEGAEKGVGTIKSVNGKVFVDTIIVWFFVPEYHTTLVRADKAPIQDGDAQPQEGDGTHIRVLKSTAAAFAHTQILEALERASLTNTTSRDVQLKGGLRELGTPRENMKAHIKRHDAAVAAAEEGGYDAPEEPTDVALEQHRMRDTKAILDRIRREGAAMRSNTPTDGPPLVVMNRTAAWEDESTKFYYNCVKIAPKNEEIEPVLQAVHSGALATLGFYHLELDTSTDCSGIFSKFEVANDLVTNRNFRYQKGFNKEDKFHPGADDPTYYAADYDRKDDNSEGCILDNSHYVGNNCLSIMRESKVKFGPDGIDPPGIAYHKLTMPEKGKAYNKFVSNFEQKAIAQDLGSHILDNTVLMFERESRTIVLIATFLRGLFRAENTAFVRGVQPDVAHLYTHSSVDAVRAALEETCAFARQELVYDQPLQAQWNIWCKNINHVLIIVHSRYDRAVIVYTLNEVTTKIAGMHINRWSKVYRYVLERCAFGKLPTDVITVHTGRDVPSRRTKQPCKKRKSRALPPEEKARRKKERKIAKGVEKRANQKLQDIRTCFPAKASAGAEEEAEAEESSLHTGAAPDDESESDESDSESDDDDDDDAGPPDDETATQAQSTADDNDCTRYDYKPGWVAPADPEGALITSIRLFRAPLKCSDLADDGDYFPETRLCQDTLGTCFKPDGKVSKELFSDRPGQVPFALPAGYNDDSTHIEDVGDKAARGRRADIIVAKERQANGGMAPNVYCNLSTFPPLKPDSKPRFCHIIATQTQLPIVPDAVLNKRALGERTPEAPQDRVDRLRKSFDTTEAEREATIKEQTHFLRSDSYKTDVLHKGGTRASALDTLPFGERTLVAVELQKFQANKFRRPHTLVFHTAAMDGTITSFASRKVLNQPFFDCRDILAPLFNAKGAQGKCVCYMHEDAQGGSIGTLTRVNTASALDCHGRPILALDCVLTLPNGTQVHVLENGGPGADAKRQTQAADTAEPADADTVEPMDTDTAEPMDAEEDAEEDAEADAEADTEEDPTAALPTIVRPTQCPSTEFRPLGPLLSSCYDKIGGAVVTILRVGSCITYNQGEWLPLEVRIEPPHVHAGVHTVMSRGSIRDAVDTINTRNCTAFVHGLTNKQGEQAVIVPQEDVWWQAAFHSKNAYRSLPQIARQMPNPPSVDVIVAAKNVPNFRRDRQVPIVKMQDGRVYSFTCPQTAVPLNLQESNNLNLRLDTAAWSVTSV